MWMSVKFNRCVIDKKMYDEPMMIDINYMHIRVDEKAGPAGETVLTCHPLSPAEQEGLDERLQDELDVGADAALNLAKIQNQRLKIYLELEGAMRVLDEEEDPFVDVLRSALDPIRNALSDIERAVLDKRP